MTKSILIRSSASLSAALLAAARAFAAIAFRPVPMIDLAGGGSVDPAGPLGQTRLCSDCRHRRCQAGAPVCVLLGSVALPQARRHCLGDSWAAFHAKN